MHFCKKPDLHGMTTDLKDGFCSGLLKSFFRDTFETKFIKWSVVYLLPDINLCLQCWESLFLWKKFHSCEFGHSCGVNLIGLLLTSFLEGIE